MIWPGNELTISKLERAECGNNSDLVMTEESDFPSSSAQVKPALDTLLPCLVLILRMPWLLSTFFLCS